MSEKEYANTKIGLTFQNISYSNFDQLTFTNVMNAAKFFFTNDTLGSYFSVFQHLEIQELTKHFLGNNLTTHT